MALLHLATRLAARKMPRVINPTAHAVFDYAVSGLFLVMAARLWKRHRRAALGCVFCGGAGTLNAVLTDYPGGVFKTIEYKTHGRIDAGLAAMTAAAPQFLGFSNQPEARFFSLQAITETVITGLTDFNYYAAVPEEHPLKAAS